jgi:hypothetical protein
MKNVLRMAVFLLISGLLLAVVALAIHAEDDEREEDDEHFIVIDEPALPPVIEENITAEPIISVETRNVTLVQNVTMKPYINLTTYDEILKNIDPTKKYAYLALPVYEESFISQLMSFLGFVHK